MPRFFAALAPCGQPATPSHSLARSGGKWQQPTDPREAVIGADEPLISLHYLILSYHIMQCTPVRPFRYRHVQVQYVRLAANGGAAEWGQTGPVICGLASPRTRTCVVPCSRDCRLAASRGSGRWRESWTRRAPVRLVTSRRPYRTLAVLEGPGAHRPKRPKRSPRGRHCEAVRRYGWDQERCSFLLRGPRRVSCFRSLGPTGVWSRIHGRAVCAVAGSGAPEAVCVVITETGTKELELKQK